jgi:hypothetical protein
MQCNAPIFAQILCDVTCALVVACKARRTGGIAKRRLGASEFRLFFGMGLQRTDFLFFVFVWLVGGGGGGDMVDQHHQLD